eukprot:jgi/Mesvir1/19270/Mv10350-RA.1
MAAARGAEPVRDTWAVVTEERGGLQPATLMRGSQTAWCHECQGRVRKTEPEPRYCSGRDCGKAYHARCLALKRPALVSQDAAAADPLHDGKSPPNGDVLWLCPECAATGAALEFERVPESLHGKRVVPGFHDEWATQGGSQAALSQGNLSSRGRAGHPGPAGMNASTTIGGTSAAAGTCVEYLVKWRDRWLHDCTWVPEPVLMEDAAAHRLVAAWEKKFATDAHAEGYLCPDVWLPSVAVRVLAARGACTPLRTLEAQRVAGFPMGCAVTELLVRWPGVEMRCTWEVATSRIFDGKCAPVVGVSSQAWLLPRLQARHNECVDRALGRHRGKPCPELPAGTALDAPQLQAVPWLCERMRRGPATCLFAGDRHMGKVVAAACALGISHAEGCGPPSMILTNDREQVSLWTQVLSAWAPHLNCVPFARSPNPMSAALTDDPFYTWELCPPLGEEGGHREGQPAPDVVVTTFDDLAQVGGGRMAARSADGGVPVDEQDASVAGLLRGMRMSTLVVDARVLRGPHKQKQAEGLLAQMSAEHRACTLVVADLPLQPSLQKWLPQLFGAEVLPLATHNAGSSSVSLTPSPACLVQRASDHRPHLASLVEHLVPARISPLQVDAYWELLEPLIPCMGAQGMDDPKPCMGAILQLLACCQVTEKGRELAQATHQERARNAMAPTPEPAIDARLAHGGKLGVLRQLVDTLRRRNKKVAIMVHSIELCDLLDDFLCCCYGSREVQLAVAPASHDSRSKAAPEPSVLIVRVDSSSIPVLPFVDAVVVFASSGDPMEDVRAALALRTLRPFALFRLYACGTVEEGLLRLGRKIPYVIKFKVKKHARAIYGALLQHGLGGDLVRRRRRGPLDPGTSVGHSVAGACDSSSAWPVASAGMGVVEGHARRPRDVPDLEAMVAAALHDTEQRCRGIPPSTELAGEVPGDPSPAAPATSPGSGHCGRSPLSLPDTWTTQITHGPKLDAEGRPYLAPEDAVAELLADGVVVPDVAFWTDALILSEGRDDRRNAQLGRTGSSTKKRARGEGQGGGLAADTLSIGSTVARRRLQIDPGVSLRNSDHGDEGGDGGGAGMGIGGCDEEVDIEGEGEEEEEDKGRKADPDYTCPRERRKGSSGNLPRVSTGRQAGKSAILMTAFVTKVMEGKKSPFKHRALTREPGGASEVTPREADRGQSQGSVAVPNASNYIRLPSAHRREGAVPEAAAGRCLVRACGEAGPTTTNRPPVIAATGTSRDERGTIAPSDGIVADQTIATANGAEGPLGPASDRGAIPPSRPNVARDVTDGVPHLVEPHGLPGNPGMRPPATSREGHERSIDDPFNDAQGDTRVDEAGPWGNPMDDIVCFGIDDFVRSGVDEGGSGGVNYGHDHDDVCEDALPLDENAARMPSFGGHLSERSQPVTSPQGGNSPKRMSGHPGGTQGQPQPGGGQPPGGARPPLANGAPATGANQSAVVVEQRVLGVGMAADASSDASPAQTSARGGQKVGQSGNVPAVPAEGNAAEITALTPAVTAGGLPREDEDAAAAKRIREEFELLRAAMLAEKAKMAASKQAAENCEKEAALLEHDATIAVIEAEVLEIFATKLAASAKAKREMAREKAEWAASHRAEAARHKDVVATAEEEIKESLASVTTLKL